MNILDRIIFEVEADTEGTKSKSKCDGKFSPPVEEDEPKI